MADAAPSFVVESRDRTPIAVFASGPASESAARGRPVVLVHGTIADHTAFRVVGPMLSSDRTVYAIDRRARGASGDGPAYAFEREAEDVAAVVDAVSAWDPDGEVDVVGHSFGGRVSLRAVELTSRLRRLVAYEGAPAPPGSSYHAADLEDELRTLLDAGEWERTVETFLRAVVGMSEDELVAYRANPVWPARVAAAPTILREISVESAPSASLVALASVDRPVLQVLGGESLPVFAEATRALDAVLADGRVVVIPGARHAAHHTHPELFVLAVREFLDAETP